MPELPLREIETHHLHAEEQHIRRNAERQRVSQNRVNPHGAGQQHKKKPPKKNPAFLLKYPAPAFGGAKGNRTPDLLDARASDYS
ncbi:hypothetical protein, partial [Nocardia cyriacigeorgica]|uniref:hypothetical protein n=1 Tax=Nocardia cyriacigeorgica TaxID=135487 RepID=UPI002456302D